jgi:mRNA interferase MazF
LINPRRGEVWLAELDPTLGREQAGTRPALVVSDNRFNHSAAGLVVICPITSRDKGMSFHVNIAPPEGGLDRDSYVMCDQPRTVSKERLKRKLGLVQPPTMRSTEAHLSILLGL